MKYIKIYEKYLNIFNAGEEPKFGFPDVNIGDLVKIYGKNTLYIVLGDDHNPYPNKNWAAIGTMLYKNGSVEVDKISLYDPNIVSDEWRYNMEFIKYRFLTNTEKLKMFQAMIVEKIYVDLIKKKLDIDLTMLLGYEEYELKNKMEKYNL